ncbi:hypothetical protein ASG22_10555 [Chryseobacterium sp. Leaf405]|uniref:hypothetical protein n=1 Tax=Chryseobacterium sp. Leaf405 TaxID=1736367 RepID=UPI0006F38F7D|nr:hypothetical protein [Chryseobacterium sp. Leaf405]KQT24438.1 hypothetical protein ASG22_10555 [Chryseobacterium sp. Leaf405]
MKKLVLVAGLFIAFAANAQQGRGGFRNDKVEYHHRDYGRLKLSQRQEKEIFALSKQRLTAREYDAKLRRILSKDQYAQYQRNGFHKDREVAINKPFRR